MSKSERLYFLLSDETSAAASYAGGNFYHVYADVVRLDPETRTPRNLHGDAHGLADFRCYSQGDAKSLADATRADHGMYAWEYEWKPFSLRADDIRRLAPVAAKLERGLAKIRETEGSPLSYGQYVGRVARVLGVTGMLVRRESHRASSYDEFSYRHMSIGEGIAHIDYMIQAKAATFAPREQEAEA